MPVIKQLGDGSLAKRRLPDEVSGPTGPVGPDGAQGPAGYTGPRGDTGVQGRTDRKVRKAAPGRVVRPASLVTPGRRVRPGRRCSGPPVRRVGGRPGSDRAGRQTPACKVRKARPGATGVSHGHSGDKGRQGNTGPRGKTGIQVTLSSGAPGHRPCRRARVSGPRARRASWVCRVRPGRRARLGRRVLRVFKVPLALLATLGRRVGRHSR